MLPLTSLSGIIVGSRVAKAELATANSLATFQSEKQLSNFKLDLKKLSGSSWLVPGFGSRAPAPLPTKCQIGVRMTCWKVAAGAMY